MPEVVDPRGLVPGAALDPARRLSRGRGRPPATGLRLGVGAAA